jgi:hypothetical protein
VIIYTWPLTTSRILVTAVLIQPELLEPIWRQLGVPDRVLIDAYRGKSRRRELLPAGQPQCVKDPADPSGHRLLVRTEDLASCLRPSDASGTAYEGKTLPDDRIGATPIGLSGVATSSADSKRGPAISEIKCALRRQVDFGLELDPCFRRRPSGHRQDAGGGGIATTRQQGTDATYMPRAARPAPCAGLTCRRRWPDACDTRQGGLPGAGVYARAGRGRCRRWRDR